MGPEDGDYEDIYSLLQSTSWIYRESALSQKAKMSGAIGLNPVDTETATAQPLERKQIITRIQTEFESRIQETRGACYSTEVRSSGVLVCGVHHSLWDESADTCVNLQQELTAVAQAASAALLGTSAGASEG